MSNLFSKDKVIRKCMVHYLKKNVLSSFESRKCLCLGFRKYIVVRMSRPTVRPQLKRNKSLRVGDLNRCVYLTTRRTAEHKKRLVSTIVESGESATECLTNLTNKMRVFVSQEKSY